MSIKNKLNKSHYHEATDRVFMIQCIIEEHLQKHSVFKKEKKLGALLEEVQDILGEIYQQTGYKM